MIDNATGRVPCAVLSHGGFPGIGDRSSTRPRAKRRDNTQIGGYIPEAPPSDADQPTASWHGEARCHGICMDNGPRPLRTPILGTLLRQAGRAWNPSMT